MKLRSLIKALEEWENRKVGKDLYRVQVRTKDGREVEKEGHWRKVGNKNVFFSSDGKDAVGLPPGMEVKDGVVENLDEKFGKYFSAYESSLNNESMTREHFDKTIKRVESQWKRDIAKLKKIEGKDKVYGPEDEDQWEADVIQDAVFSKDPIASLSWWLKDKDGEFERGKKKLLRDVMGPGTYVSVYGVNDTENNKERFDYTATRFISVFRKSIKKLGLEGKGHVNVEMKPAGTRASFESSPYSKINIGLGDSSSTVFHEMGHWLCHYSPQIRTAGVALLKKRTEFKGVEKLGGNYRDDEHTVKDKFFDPYVGKIYPHATDTEVISMGLQHFVSTRCALELKKKDPELFFLCYGILKGMWT